MNKITIITTRGCDLESIKDLQAEFESIGVEAEQHEMFLKGAAPTPEYVEVIAEVFTWANVFKIAATAFFATLGKEAAKNLWCHKKEIALALMIPAVRPIKLIANRLFQVQKKSDPNTQISLAIPIPSDFPATAVTFVAKSELEVSVYLACFSLKVEDIANAILRFQTEGNISVVSVHVHLLDNGQFNLKLNDVMSGKSSNVIV